MLCVNVYVWLQSRCFASSASRLACVKAARQLASVVRRLKWLSCRICWFMWLRVCLCTAMQLPRWDVQFRMMFTTLRTALSSGEYLYIVVQVFASSVLCLPQVWIGALSSSGKIQPYLRTFAYIFASECLFTRPSVFFCQSYSVASYT